MDEEMSEKEKKKLKDIILQKIRNNNKIIRILIILVISSCVIALGIYFKIYELLNLSAVILGWFLATYTINLFQKNRLEKDLRDKMFIEYNALASLSG